MQSHIAVAEDRHHAEDVRDLNCDMITPIQLYATA